MPSDTMVGIEALLGHERWVRRLARALVRDDDEAEELVQEARLAWWRRPPDDPERARSWLRTVVRNLVRNRHRGRESRRRLEEELAHHTDVSPSTEALVERLEVHRELAEAVSRLGEPFREVVLLRYYEELTSAEIARRLGIPAGTVRWQLKTGLDRLRAVLDERHGGKRSAWVALLLPLAGREDARAAETSPAPAAPTFPIAWVLLVAALGSLGAALFVHRQGRRPAALAGAGAPGSSPASARSPAPRLALDRRAGGESPGAEPAELPRWILLEGARGRAVAGRVMAGGRPVAGARMRLTNGTLSRDRRLDRHAESGPDGTFAFPIQPPTGWFLTASAPGLRPAILYLELRAARPRSSPGDQPVVALVIELGACGEPVHGTVRDAGGGAIAGARVRFAAAGDNGGVEVLTGEGGGYRLCPGTAGGPAPPILVAEADGYGTVEARLPAAGEAVDFLLQPQASVAGRTVGERGEPLGGIDVLACLAAPATPGRPGPAGHSACQMGRSDGEGRFELAALAPGRYRLAFAGDDAFRAGDDRVTVGPGEHARGLELRMSPVVLVEGTAFREGAPAADAELTFQSEAVARRTRTDEQGRFRVRLPAGREARISALDPASDRPWTPVLAPASLRPAGDGRDVRVELPALSAGTPSEAVTPAGGAAPAPAHGLEATFGDRVRLLGYDGGGEHLPRGGQLEITLHYRVLAPLPGWRLFTHLVGENEQGFVNLDHGAAGGSYPVGRWQAGETVRDRFVVRAPAGLAPGVYQLMTGFWNPGENRRLPVTPAEKSDGRDRLRVLTVTVD